eukprot:gene7716-9224_t
MSVFKSNSDLLKCLVECIGQICREWNLELEENEAGDQALKVYTFSVISPDRKACTRLSAVLVFDDQVMIYAKLDSKCRTVNFNVNDYAEAPHSRFPFHGKLNSKLVATIFAPFFRPNKEYHNLCQISAVATIHICSYLSATELCQLTQTHRIFSNATVADVLWSQLILKDFPTLQESTSRTNKDEKSLTGSNSKGEGTAKARYRTLYQQRVIERRSHRAAELRYLEALEQERFYLEQMRTDNFPVFAPDLVLPPLRLGVPGIDNSPQFRLPRYHRDTHDTWF